MRDKNDGNFIILVEDDLTLRIGLIQIHLTDGAAVVVPVRPGGEA